MNKNSGLSFEQAKCEYLNKWKQPTLYNRKEDVIIMTNFHKLTDRMGRDDNAELAALLYRESALAVLQLCGHLCKLGIK